MVNAYCSTACLSRSLDILQPTLRSSPVLTRLRLCIPHSLRIHTKYYTHRGMHTTHIPYTQRMYTTHTTVTKHLRHTHTLSLCVCLSASHSLAVDLYTLRTHSLSSLSLSFLASLSPSVLAIPITSFSVLSLPFSCLSLYFHCIR